MPFPAISYTIYCRNPLTTGLVAGGIGMTKKSAKLLGSAGVSRRQRLELQRKAVETACQKIKSPLTGGKTAGRRTRLRRESRLKAAVPRLIGLTQGAVRRTLGAARCATGVETILDAASWESLRHVFPRSER
jgi:hypothetical protein